MKRIVFIVIVLSFLTACSNYHIEKDENGKIVKMDDPGEYSKELLTQSLNLFDEEHNWENINIGKENILRNLAYSNYKSHTYKEVFSCVQEALLKSFTINILLTMTSLISSYQ